MRQYLGKLIFILAVLGLFGLAWALKGIQFGRDLAGGAELRYGITKRVTERYHLYRRYQDDRRDPEKVRELEDRLAGLKERRQKEENEEEIERIDRQIREVEFRLDPEKIEKAMAELKRLQAEVGRGADIVRRRLDEASMQDIEVRTIGESRLLIVVPFPRDAPKRFGTILDDIENKVKQQGVLRFHLAPKREESERIYGEASRRIKDGRPAPESYIYVLPEGEYEEVAGKLKGRGLQDPLEAGYLPWTPPPEERRGKKKGERKLLVLDREHVLDGTVVDHAYMRFGEEGWQVNLEFTSAGAAAFESMSEKHVGEQLAVVLDDVCHSAPVIKQRIAGGARITGRFTEEESRTLANVLTSGNLPVQIQFESKSVIGPSLGRDSIRRGMLAILVAGGGVLLFVLVYYLPGGVVANLGMFMNLIIVMGCMAAFNAKLTLPGIAGLLLTVGMAVDANVLIFERIREEKAKGRTLRLAVQAGYSRAFLTIIDANLTTLITALVLYWFGTGPIRGFAVTLTLGILASLFTALYASRALIELLITKGWISEFTMLKAIGATRVSFMRMRPLAYTLSALLVAGGLYAFFSYPDKYGIDFVGGTQLRVRLKAPMPDGQMRDQIAARALQRMQEQESKAAAGGGRAPMDYGEVRVLAYEPERRGASSTFSLLLRMDVRELEKYRGYLTELLGEKLHPEAPFPSQESIGRAVSQELGASAARAVVFALILIFLYIVLRFEFNPSFGVGAVAAVAHDVAIAAGAMAAADWAGLLPAKLDLAAVAALLTIVGYSLNDTIVVFDRIREIRLVSGKGRPLGDVVDEAVNACLARTFITSLTTLLAVLALFFLGGEATRGFAFAMIVGVLVGTYSSIFIAAPLVVQWEGLRARPRLKKAALIGLAILALAGIGGLITSNVWSARENRRRSRCEKKLEDIASACRRYAARHEDSLPPELGALLPDYLGEKGMLALGGPDELDGVAYHYVSGLKSTDPSDWVLAYDPPAAHPRGGHVVFVDGTVEWMDDRAVKAAVAATSEKAAARDRPVRIIRAEVPAGD